MEPRIYKSTESQQLWLKTQKLLKEEMYIEREKRRQNHYDKVTKYRQKELSELPHTVQPILHVIRQQNKKLT